MAEKATMFMPFSVNKERLVAHWGDQTTETRLPVRPPNLKIPPGPAELLQVE